MTNLVLDAAQYLLMDKVAARLDYDLRCVFWETLLESAPGITAYLPALAAAVRAVRNPIILDGLSSLALPAVLSPETVNWRPGLIEDWEGQLKKTREGLDRSGVLGYPYWKEEYMSSLQGLMQVDRCGMPPGITCPSVLPTLLDGVRYACAHRKFTGSRQLGCLAILAEWRPAQNVTTDPAVLNECREFWLELYQQSDMDAGEEEPNAQIVRIIRKGIAAKALLNLMEIGREKEPGTLASISSLLLENLTMATKLAIETNASLLDWLSWQPQDITRFPIDKLAKLPETLLKEFRRSCQTDQKSNQSFDKSWDQKPRTIRRNSLRELVRWDQAGLRAPCGIDLLPHVVTEMRTYLNKFRGNCNFMSEYLLNHEVSRWLVRDEVANVNGGRELLQNLETQWQYECEAEYCGPDSLRIAWGGRMQLQRAGLATETASDFHENLLKAIKKGKTIVLLLWKPEKDTPDRTRKRWERLLERRVQSDNEEIAHAAALALLRQRPDDSPVVQRQKLHDVLSVLPKHIRPKVSMTELAHLMGEWPMGNPNSAHHAAPNQRWQFRDEETRFRVPTGPVDPGATPVTVQTARPDRMTQKKPRHDQSHT